MANRKPGGGRAQSKATGRAGAPTPPAPKPRTVTPSGAPVDPVTGAPIPRGQRRDDMIAKRRQARLRVGERQRRQRLIKRLSIAAVAVVILASLGYVANGIIQDRLNNKAIDGVASFDEVAGHQDGALTFAQTPPAGGTHNSVWQNCGYYAAPIANENGVHSLEHGAVWITYQPDLASDQVDIIKNDANQSYVIASPHSDLPAPVVVSAWGKQLTLQSANDPRLGDFLAKYRQGSQTPEPGAACSGGTSATVSQ